MSEDSSHAQRCADLAGTPKSSPQAGKKERSAAAGVAGISLLALVLTLTGCVDPNHPPPTGALSRYPRTPALDLVAETHREAASDREGLILLTTWFLDGDPRVALMCRVRSDNHVSTFRFISNYSDGGGAIQNSRASDPSPEQSAAIRDAVRDLPAPQNPRVENLVIVSFPRGGTWVTRTYDRLNLPPAVVQLFAATGAPIDTTQ